MPGLDVLRGCAILLVVVYHGFAFHAGGPGLTRWQNTFCYAAEYGQLGVHLFFVLSGFLISGILLDTRDRPNYYRRFYFRRVIRILPAYLLMIAVLRLTHSISWRFVAVSLLYLCNMSGVLGASPEYGSFWSLSVEEQFYLVWPWTVRTLKRRSLWLLSASIVMFVPALRYLLSRHGSDIFYKTWDVADFFAAGALVALAVRSPQLSRRSLKTAVASCILVAAGVVLVGIPWHVGTFQDVTQAAASLRLTPYVFLFSAFLLLAFLAPFLSRGVGRVMVFYGDISYGLYLCHSMIFLVVNRHLFLATDVSPFERILLQFVVELSASTAIAWVSRWTFEEFFLRLKNKPMPRFLRRRGAHEFKSAA